MDLNKTLLLIDANALIHRCFHALPPLTDVSGNSAGALYGIGSLLLRLKSNGWPEYGAVLFDRPEPTFRKELYEDYKGHRPKTPDDLVYQIIEARKIFQAFGFRVIEQPGFEADDLIATCVEKFKKEEKITVEVLTGDLDALQLVEGDKVVVRALRRGITDAMLYNRDAVFERYGLEPHQLIEYKILVGDQSDNIKGVNGIGEKTTTKILKEWGTIESAIEHLPLGESLRAKLEAAKDQIELNRKLVTLCREAPLGIDSLDDLKTNISLENLTEYLLSLGFDSLIKRLHGEPEKSAPSSRAQKEKKEEPKNQASLF